MGATDPRVRLYGHLNGEASFAQVTRGMGLALHAAGELAGVCPIRAADDEELLVGDAAPISLNCGNPMGLMVAHRRGNHRSHWLLLAPNSEGLPKGLKETLLEPSKILPYGMLTGGLLAPSSWAAGVLRREFSERPVVLCPHGVTPEIHRVDAAAREAVRQRFLQGKFDVLHMTSTEAERKGTKLLLAAWKRLRDKHVLPAGARLHIVMNPVQLSKVRWWCADVGLTEADVSATPGLAYDQAGVAAMYGEAHVLCQPSRGEGFGLCVAEALSCGVPVVATACTGHAELLGSRPPGSVIVEHGASAPMDDFPGSVAPTVTVDAIYVALERAFEYWGSLAAGAETNALALASEWSWENKSVPGLRRMIQEAEKDVR